MAEIINLRRARKDKKRMVEAAAADQNRVIFGRSKAEKYGTEAQSKIDDTWHAGHLIVPRDMDKPLE
jgi:hypothetical protein